MLGRSYPAQLADSTVSPDALNNSAAAFGEFIIGLELCQATDNNKLLAGQAQCLAQAVVALEILRVQMVAVLATPQVMGTILEMLCPLGRWQQLAKGACQCLPWPPCSRPEAG